MHLPHPDSVKLFNLFSIVFNLVVIQRFIDRMNKYCGHYLCPQFAINVILEIDEIKNIYKLFEITIKNS